MKLTRTLFASTLLAGTAVSALAAPQAPHAGDEPRLVVIISVDGLSWPRLAAYRPWYTAGLKRLLDEGYVLTEARYRHINTETGPGHASLGTGAPPRVHGIVTNLWEEPGRDGSLRRVFCTDQPAAPSPGSPPMFYREIERAGAIHVFALSHQLERWQSGGEVDRRTTRAGYGPRGETVIFDSDDAIFLYNFKHDRPAEPYRGGVMRGPANLRVPTLGDRLAEQRPGARVFAVSAKDRGAILLAGRDRRHVVTWFDQETGRFVTSAAYDTASPLGAAGRKVIEAYNTERAGGQLPARFGLAWARFTGPAPAGPLPTPVPGLAAFQNPVLGIGFDHPLTAGMSGYFGAVYSSPYIDELIADVAIAWLANAELAIGRGPQPDLLAISFSSQDAVAHAYGPESEENLDVLRRLDVQIGRVLDAVEKAVGRGRVTLGLSADHGFAEIPEAAALRGPARDRDRAATAHRLPGELLALVNRNLDERLCLAPGSAPIAARETFSLYYDRPHLPLPTVAGPCGPAGTPVGAAEIDRELPGALAACCSQLIESVLLTSQRDRWPAGETAELARNDLDPERSGDAFLFPRAGVLAYWSGGRGTGHGSHHEMDTHVPLLFWGAPFPAGTSAEPATPYDLAPTLARLVGVRLPDATGASRIPPP